MVVTIPYLAEYVSPFYVSETRDELYKTKEKYVKIKYKAHPWVNRNKYIAAQDAKDAIVPKGLVLFVSEPFAHIVSSKNRGKCCDHCLHNPKTR